MKNLYERERWWINYTAEDEILKDEIRIRNWHRFLLIKNKKTGNAYSTKFRIKEKVEGSNSKDRNTFGCLLFPQNDDVVSRLKGQFCKENYLAWK